MSDSTPNQTTPPPDTVLIFQTASAIEAVIQYPLASFGLMANEHYLVTSSVTEATKMLSDSTALLVVGAHQSGGTEGLDDLIAHARGLNPGVRVVGYSACNLGSLLLDTFIDKTSGDHIERLRFVMEVCCAIDKVKNAGPAHQIFSGLKGS